jgi:hypothetical protein
MANIEFPKDKEVNLDLGCGDNKREGFYGIDIAKTAACDYQFDLTKTPWPIDDEVVDSIHCSHFFEHLDGAERIAFMHECYRILKDGKQMVIIVPHWSSMRSIQDPTHKWPPVAESSFLYFNKKWMDDNKLQHYGITCDFDFGYGYSVDPDVQVRNQEFQAFAVKHYNNAVMDLFVTLTKKPKAK